MASSHFQLQGTWTAPAGTTVNYILLQVREYLHVEHST